MEKSEALPQINDLLLENLALKRQVALLESQLAHAPLGTANSDQPNQQDLEHRLRHRITLKHMMAEISTRFINMSADHADQELQHMLTKLGEFTEADRCTIVSVKLPEQIASCTHEWCAPGIASVIKTLQNIPAKTLPTIGPIMASNQVLHIADSKSLPPGPGKEFLLAWGMRAFTAIPLITNNQIQGCITLTNLSKVANYSEDDLAEFKLLGEIVAGGQQRWQMECHLQRINANLEQRVIERTADMYDLYNNAPCGYHSLDCDGKIIHINDTELRWLGYAREEMIGLPFTHFLTAEGKLAHERSRSILLNQSDINGLEIELVRYDGSLLPVSVSASVLRDKHNQFVMSRWNIFDITERRHAINALRESDARLNYLLAETPALIFSLGIGEDRRIIVNYCSQSIRTILGYEPSDFIGQTGFIEKNQHPDNVLPSIDKFYALQPNDELVFSVRFRHAHGEYRWLSCGTRLVKHEPTNSLEIIGYAVDVTDLKTAEAELQAQRDFARQVMDTINEGLVVADNMGNIEYINPYLEQLFGQKLDQVIGKTSSDFILPEAQPLIQMERQTRLQGVRGQYEIDIVTPDNRSRHMLINASPRWHNGQVTGMIATMIDLTEREEIEAQLRQSRDNLSAANFALERAARMKDEFLASMSHELRTPLTAILGLSEGLLESILGPLNQKQRDALITVEASGRHLLNLINDLLDLSKIEAGVMDLVASQFNVSTLCNSGLQFIKEMATRKRIKTFLTVESTVENMVADERRLKQMLVNLLSNAVKFTPDGGQIGLEVTGDAENGVVHFSVWDTGIGINQKDIDRLFQPFVQLDNTLARQYNGTGLGLSLVSRMAELHGGSITVTSTLGSGSRFTLSLPWINETPADEFDHIDENNLGDYLTQLRHTKILVVEDIASDATRMAQYMTELNAQTIVLPSGHNVVEQAIDNAVDVILLDLILPDHNGWDILKALKTDPRSADIPVIIISVLDERLHGLVEGAAECLVKPVKREQIQSALAHVLRYTASVEQQTTLAASKGESRAPISLLLVEDNEANIQTMTAYLEGKGYMVTVARNGAEGLALTRSNHPDLILMDIQMPVLDGIEATRQLRLDIDPKVSQVPIIALTALAMPGDRNRLLSVGANEYLAKPVNLKQLMTLIENLVKPAPIPASVPNITLKVR